MIEIFNNLKEIQKYYDKQILIFLKKMIYILIQ